MSSVSRSVSPGVGLLLRHRRRSSAAHASRRVSCAVPSFPRRYVSYVRSIARLADRVARLVALLLQALVVLGGDLADVAEHLRGERLVRVLAQEAVSQADAGELVLVLEQVVDLLLLDPSLHDHRRQRVVTGLGERGDDVLRRHARHDREPPQLRALRRPRPRQVARPKLDTCAGSVRDERHGRCGRGSRRAAPRAAACARGCRSPARGSARRRAPGAPTGAGRAPRRARARRSRGSQRATRAAA